VPELRGLLSLDDNQPRPSRQTRRSIIAHVEASGMGGAMLIPTILRRAFALIASPRRLSCSLPGGSVAQAAQPNGKFNVFVSYSRDDLAFADRLRAALLAYEFAVTIDRESITRALSD
jgi:hypothetical protein